MPVTAKLSRDFYDRFGDQVANELVEWFNQVDATYRGDLRVLNELNFARFDATQGRRFAESDAKWAQRMALWDKRFAESGAKWEQRLVQQDVKWEQRLAQQDAKWEQRLAQQDAKWEQRFAQQEATLEQRFAQIDVRFAAFEARIIRWMFLFWVTTLAAVVGLARLKP